MIKTTEKNIHWDYYLALESDINDVARYIEFDESNFDTYSIELSHLLLAASSEVDVVIKELCRLLSDGSKPKNIYNYRKIISEHLPAVIDQTVISRKHGLTLTPWSSWHGEEHPTWWDSYNNVKHERSIHFSKANLKNVLNSVAALLVVNIYYNHKKMALNVSDYPYDLKHSIDDLQPCSSLFQLNDPMLYMRD